MSKSDLAQEIEKIITDTIQKGKPMNNRTDKERLIKIITSKLEE